MKTIKGWKEKCKVKPNLLKKIQQKLKENKIFAFIINFFPKNIFLLIVMIISLLLLFKYSKNSNQTIIYSQPISNSNFGAILVDPVTIDFEKTNYDIMPDYVCIKFGTYQRNNNANYKYSLYKTVDNKKEIINETIFNSSNLKDGENYCFGMNINADDKLSDYSVSITPIYATSSNSITIFNNSETNEASYTLVKSSSSVRSYIKIFIPFIMLVYFFINYLINTKKVSISKYWIILIIFYFVPIMLVYPPYEVPDEPVHFYNSYRFSQLDLKQPLYQSVNNIYINMPNNISCLDYSRIEKIDKVQNLNDINNCIMETGNSLDDTYKDYNRITTKLGYIVPAIGIRYTDHFSNSPLKIFYSGRLINLLFSAILILIALIITPKYKELFLLVGTIPMFVQQMISYSYDSILNSSCLLVMAIILNMVYSKKSKLIINYIVLVVLGTIIANLKYIYLPLFLFVLFVPNEKFRNKKYLKYLYCFGLILISYLLGKFFQDIFIEGSNNIGLSSSENLNYILSNPLKILPIAFNTFKINGLFYLQSLIGYFSWFKYKMSDLFIILYIAMFTYIILSSEKINDDKITKIISYIGLLTAFAGSFAAMYFYWSQPKLSYVDGVQGRYFIPLLIPLALLLFPKKVRYKLNTNNIYYFVNIILSHYLLFALLSFY